MKAYHENDDAENLLMFHSFISLLLCAHPSRPPFELFIFFVSEDFPPLRLVTSGIQFLFAMVILYTATACCYPSKALSLFSLFLMACGAVMEY